MLIQISENSAAVTPYGSLAHVYQNVGVEHRGFGPSSSYEPAFEVPHANSVASPGST
jgi:hypothetical protein